MKLKRIAALCKQEKRAIIYQKWEADCGTGSIMTQQWISNGYAVYAANGLPPLGKETLLRIFDVTEDKFDSWNVSNRELPESVNLGNLDDTEQEIAGALPSLYLYGTAMQAYGTTENGVIFIRSDYMSPLDGETGLEFYIRKNRGTNYLAVKSGLLLQAVILPEQFITKNFYAMMKELTFRSGKQLVENCALNYKLTIDEMDKCKWGNSAEETTRESKDEQISIVPEEGKQ